METFQPDYSQYQKKYGDTLEALARAMAETAGSGDEIGLFFLLSSVEAITAQADQIIRQVHERTGTA